MGCDRKKIYSPEKVCRNFLPRTGREFFRMILPFMLFCAAFLLIVFLNRNTFFAGITIKRILCFLILFFCWFMACRTIFSIRVLRRFIFWTVFPVLMTVCESLNFEFKNYIGFYLILPPVLLLTAGLFLIDFLQVLIFSKLRLHKISACFSAVFHILSALPPIAVLSRIFLDGATTDVNTLTAVFQTDTLEAVYYIASSPAVIFTVILSVVLIIAIFIIYKNYLCFSPVSGRNFLLLLLGWGICFSGAVLLAEHPYFSIRKSELLVKTFCDAMSYKEELRLFRDFCMTDETKKQIRTKGNDGRFLLILGEAFNRDHMSCYGYRKTTTPFLDSRRNDPRFTFFSAAYSSHTHTTETLKLLLTPRNQYDGKGVRIDGTCSIFHVLRECGYNTQVISNQYPHGEYSSHVSAISAAADGVHYLNKNPLDVLTGGTLDEQLVSEWRQSRGNAPRSFAVLHMMGAHRPYSVRFPAGFAPQLDSSYDRAVRYMDSVLEDLFRDAEKNIDAAVFVSDHGEDMQFAHDSAKATADMIRIPLIVYLSPAYAEKNPALAEKLKAAKDKVITNDLVFELILELMGIETDFTPPGLHVLSPEYRIDRKNARTLHGTRTLDMK